MFYYKQASRTLFLATITGSTFDIFLAYILVPLFGIYGAAISFLIAKIIIVIIVIILSKRYDDIGYRAVNMLKIIIPSLLFMGVGLYFSYTKYMSVFSITNFCYKIVLFIIYLIYLYFTNKKAIVEIINSGILKSLFDLIKDPPISNEYLLSKHIAMLKKGESIEQPIYSYLTCTRQRETIHVEPKEVIIIEGIMALSDRRLRNLMDLKVSQSPVT